VTTLINESVLIGFSLSAGVTVVLLLCLRSLVDRLAARAFEAALSAVYLCEHLER
jgi:hypothetical protein